VKLKRAVDGAQLTLEVWGRRIGDRFIVMANDVGAKRDFEQQVARLRRMDSMGSLVSTLSHDFNNLLGQIQILVSNIRTDLPADSETVIDLNTIENKVEDASQIVTDLLAFKENVLSPEPVWLEPVLREFVTDRRKLLPENVELSFEIRGELPSVWMTPHALRRVLDNLCRNAVEVMPNGGKLTLKCGRRTLVKPEGDERLDPGEYAVIELGDTGPGMSEAVLERLFQPFFTTKPGGRGTGVGLWTVYKIVRQVAGGITVHSQLGKGTRFELFLPHDPPGPDRGWLMRKEAPTVRN